MPKPKHKPTTSSAMQIKPVKPAPMQLDLFGMVSDPRYVNLIPFYEALPRTVPGSGWAASIKRNADGTIAPKKRSFMYDKKQYSLMMSPAYIEDANGKLEAHFPWVREERIELALLKLAVGDTFLNVNEDQHDASYSIALQTSLHAIQKAVGNKYSKAEIREGLDILAGVRFKVEGPDKSEDVVFSPIDKAYQATGDGDARLFIRFNSLITRGVVRQMWRQVDYDKLLADPSYLSRWFRKRFALRFAHAEKGSVQWRYHLNLSTIIAESGISDYAKMSEAHAYVSKVLDGLDDILDGYTATKKFENGLKGGRVLVDVTYDFKPSYAFTQEQKNINKHNIRLELMGEAKKGGMFRG